MKPAAFLLLILLGACARSEPADLASENAGDIAVEQVSDPGGDEEETALGDWRMALQGERQALEYGSQGSAPVVTIVCGERNGLVLQRRGALPPGTAPTLSVSVAGQGRQLPVVPGSGAVATQNAAIPPGDDLIERMATAQAPISLRFGDSTPLLLKPSELIGRFAQSCASGGAGRIDAAAGEGSSMSNALGNEAAPVESNAAEPANQTKAAPAR